MKLKGDLKSISLAEILKTLSDQRASGVLSITSFMGEKHLALSRGEFTVYSDYLTERMRLGEVLVARGRLTENKLEEALTIQQQEQPRPKLGELMVQRNIVSQNDIQDAIKFQLEEEICDLFTWKEAQFDFDSERSVDELNKEALAETGGMNIHKLSVDPQAMILEATRRIDDWKIIQERLPSPYLCFKMTAKGEETYRKSGMGAQRLMKLVRDGRTLETIVKMSCLGRFTACKAVIRYLDDGWITPYPSSELKELAGAHRAHGRHIDALNIYRRLLEFPITPEEEKDFTRQIEECQKLVKKSQTQMITKTVSSTGLPQIPGATSSKKVMSPQQFAAQRDRQEKREMIVQVIILLALVFGGGYGVIWYLKHDPLREEKEKVEAAADKLRMQSRYPEAVALWEKLNASMAGKTSDVVQEVQWRTDQIKRQYIDFMSVQITPIQKLEQEEKWAEVQAAYEKLQAENPGNPMEKLIQARIDKAKAKLDQGKQQESIAALQTTLSEARTAESQKNLTKAEEIYTAVSQNAPANSDPRSEAESALKRLRDIKDRAKNYFELGLDHLSKQKAERAIESFEKAASEWPDLDWAVKAKEKFSPLRLRYDQFQAALTEARAQQSHGNLDAAAAGMKKLATEYTEFEAARDLQKQAENMNADIKEAETVLARLTEAEKSGAADDAKEYYSELLKKHYGFMIARKIGLPSKIVTLPPGGTISVNGQAVGKSPLVVKLPVLDTGLTLKFEMPGFAPLEKSIPRLTPEDMEIYIKLERGVTASIALKGFPWTAPQQIGNILIAPFSQQLSTFQLPSAKPLWTSEKILTDDQFRELEDRFGGEQVWTEFKTSPVLPLTAQEWLLIAPTGDVLNLNPTTGAFQTRLQPGVPIIGTGFLERKSLLAGKPLLALFGRDHKLRQYDLTGSGDPLWEKKMESDPDDKYGPPAGVYPGEPGQIVTASRKGKLAAWDVVDGKQRWTLDLNAQLAHATAPMPAGTDGAALFWNRDGKAFLIDMLHGQKIWEWSAEAAKDYIEQATVGTKNVYVTTNDGSLLCLPRSTPNKTSPKPLWQQTLEHSSASPLLVGDKIYAGSDTGLIYALNAETGKELWRVRSEGKVLFLGGDAKGIYAITSAKKLIVIGTE